MMMIRFMNLKKEFPDLESKILSKITQLKLPVNILAISKYKSTTFKLKPMI